MKVSAVVLSLAMIGAGAGASPALAQQGGNAPGPVATGIAPASPGVATLPRPLGSTEICLLDFRYITEDPRHSVAGFAKTKDGVPLSFVVGGDGMYILMGGPGNPAPLAQRPGFSAADTPELVNFLERAAVNRNWLTIGYAAAARVGMAEQKVRYVTLNAMSTAKCS